MNSIFSSFDAACVEVLGQKIRSSFPSVCKTDDVPTALLQQQKSVVTVVVKEAEGKNYLNSKKSENPSPPKYGRKQERPRFAPELDGLNCFETLVSY